MKCIWITDGDNVKGFKCDFTPIDMLTIISGLKYITADIERHPKDRERAQGIYNKIMLGRYHDEAKQPEPQTMCYPQVDGITPSVIEPQTDCPQSAICCKPCKECGACEKECGMWEILKNEPQAEE